MWAKQTQKGFTIVELLIVIVVIGILAAITIVAYSGIQNRASDASVQSDLANITKAFEIFKIDNGQYPTAVPGIPIPTSINVKVGKGAYMISPTTPTNLTACFSDDGSEVAVVALSKSGKAFYMYSVEGTATKVLPVAWNTNSTTRCKNINANLSNNDPVTGNARNYNGYNAPDVTTGPWRAWAGGN
jgi:prepilin-type N-terminal cleavage/methylation domain-containing protein